MNYLPQDLQKLYWNVIWDAKETGFLVISSFLTWPERGTEKAGTIKEHTTYMGRLLIANNIFTLSKCNWKLILNLLQKEK